MAPTKNNSSTEDSTAIVLASNSAKVIADKVAKSKEPFRYRWQKKKDGRFEYQAALIMSQNADGTEDKLKVARTKNHEVGADEESDNDTIVHHYEGGKSMTNYSPTPDAEMFDVELKVEEGPDDEDPGASKKPTVGRKQNNLQKYVQKNKKPSPNGRVVGRKLVMWHRPRMVEKLLLHLQYECHRAGLKLPWEKAVKRLSTGSSGSSALQHLNKLRDILITEGHMVPPLLGKYSVPQDQSIRGYLRDMDGEKPTDTQVVRWGDHVEDRKENLEVEGVVRGSGNYRRGLSKAIENFQKATGERRNRLPVELRGEDCTWANAGAGKNKKVLKRHASVVSSRAESLDPAEMESEEDYNPSVAKKKVKYGLRRVVKPIKYIAEKSSDEIDEDSDEEANQTIPRAVTATMSTPQAKRLKEDARGHGLITPPSSKPVILNLRPDLLKRFPSSTGMKNDVEHSGDEIEQDVADENGSNFGTADYDASEGNGKYGAAAYPQTPTHSLAQQMTRHTGYQGTDFHGLKSQYDDAIRMGIDPKTNGFIYKKQNPVANSQAFIDGDTRVSSAYKVCAPPAYSPTPGSRKTVNPLAGTSASAFAAVPGSANGNHGMNMTYDSYMASLRAQSNVATQYGNEQQMMADSFYSDNVQYSSGSDIFQTGANSFSNGSLEYGNYDGNNDAQANFSSGVIYRNDSSVAPAPASSTDFQAASNNAVNSTTNNFENNGDTVSEARSSPAHFIDYNEYMPQETEDNKENREWRGSGYAY